MNTPSAAGSGYVTNSSCAESAFRTCTGIAPAVAPTAASAAAANATSRRNSRRPGLPVSVQRPQSSDELVSVIGSGVQEYDARERRAEPERDARDRAELEARPRGVAGGRVGVQPLVRALDQIG